jgi:hypothetical protein
MFAVSLIKTSKRLLVNRPVSAVFPCLYVNYAPNGGVPYSRTYITSKNICRNSHALLREDRDSFLLGCDTTITAFLFLHPSKLVSLWKPTNCPLSKRRIPRSRTPRRQNPHPSTRSTRTLSNSTKPRYAAPVPLWTRLVCPLSPTSYAVPLTIYCEVLP